MTNEQTELIVLQKNLNSNSLIRLYKYIKIEIVEAQIKLQLLIGKRTYVSILADIEAQQSLELRINKLKAYIDSLKQSYELIFNKINDLCYSHLTPKEQIVFREIIVNNKTIEEVFKEYEKYHLGVNEIYKIAIDLYGDLSRNKELIKR